MNSLESSIIDSIDSHSPMSSINTNWSAADYTLIAPSRSAVCSSSTTRCTFSSLYEVLERLIGEFLLRPYVIYYYRLNRSLYSLVSKAPTFIGTFHTDNLRISQSCLSCISGLLSELQFYYASLHGESLFDEYKEERNPQFDFIGQLFAFRCFSLLQTIELPNKSLSVNELPLTCDSLICRSVRVTGEGTSRTKLKHLNLSDWNLPISDYQTNWMNFLSLVNFLHIWKN